MSSTIGHSATPTSAVAVAQFALSDPGQKLVPNSVTVAQICSPTRVTVLVEGAYVSVPSAASDRNDKGVDAVPVVHLAVGLGLQTDPDAVAHGEAVRQGHPDAVAGELADQGVVGVAHDGPARRVREARVVRFRQEMAAREASAAAARRARAPVRGLRGAAHRAHVALGAVVRLRAGLDPRASLAPVLRRGAVGLLPHVELACSVSYDRRSSTEAPPQYRESNRTDAPISPYMHMAKFACASLLSCISIARIKSRTRHSSRRLVHVLGCSIARVRHSRPPAIMSGRTQELGVHEPQARIVPPHSSHSCSSRLCPPPCSERLPWHSVSATQTPSESRCRWRATRRFEPSTPPATESSRDSTSRGGREAGPSTSRWGRRREASRCTFRGSSR